MQVAVELFHLSSDAANLSLGGVTIICALLGVLGGGVLLILHNEHSKCLLGLSIQRFTCQDDSFLC